MSDKVSGRIGSADRAGRATPQAASRLDHSATIPLREGLCQLCGREYRVWSAASPLWNAVVRGGCIKGDDVFEFLCANCFMEMAEDNGIAALFRVTAERTTNLQTITPSGRVWSEGKFLWVEPDNGR